MYVFCKSVIKYLGIAREQLHGSYGFSLLLYNWCDLVTLICLLCIECPALPDPANGNIDFSSGNTIGSIATYSCEPGFALLVPCPGNLDGTRTCQDNQVWSGSDSTCEGTSS